MMTQNLLKLVFVFHLVFQEPVVVASFFGSIGNNGNKKKDEDKEVTYGLDVSFPIQRKVSTNYPWLPHNLDPENNPTPAKYLSEPIQPLGDRHSIYLQHLQACRDVYPPATNSTNKQSRCDVFEYERLLMNLRQPQSMQNYTKMGFQKIRAPDAVFDLIKDFWANNHFKGQKEKWAVGNVFTNHWESPTYLVSVDDRGLRGSGPLLKTNIWAAASATLEEWTSQELQPVSMYGIRVYTNGSIMLPHVDRLPLVVSAMINVAQDVDEDWPFEMYDHDGIAHNVTLQPGDMLLFESHSVIHGHPFPLKGRLYAMIFIHFEPTGHPLHRDKDGKYYQQVDDKYKESVKQGFGGQSAEHDGKLPPYINRESPEEENWRKLHPDGWKPPYPVLPPEAHVYARTGKVDELKDAIMNDNKILSARDERGWQVLHQAVSSGMKEAVELLVELGAEINARTYGGYGDTPLRIAEKELGTSHPIVRYLKGLGALSLGPEL